jgi:preprotein translocase subunit SecA
MDSLREAVYLRAYGQKDPLIEYKTEAYDMFVELMTSIKNEVLNNLFRSTSNLMAFEQFLSSLPQFLLHQERPSPAGAGDAGVHIDPAATRPAGIRQNPPTPATRGLEPDSEPGLELPIRREMPKVGRNEPCPCGSGKKFKNCCGRMA